MALCRTSSPCHPSSTLHGPPSSPHHRQSRSSRQDGCLSHLPLNPRAHPPVPCLFPSCHLSPWNRGPAPKAGPPGEAPVTVCLSGDPSFTPDHMSSHPESPSQDFFTRPVCSTRTGCIYFHLPKCFHCTCCPRGPPMVSLPQPGHFRNLLRAVHIHYCRKYLEGEAMGILD